MRLSPLDPYEAGPYEVGAFRLEALGLGQMTEVLPIGGADVGQAMQAAIGIGFPSPGESSVAADVRVLWFGRDAALVIGASVEIEGALCVDQSDGWAALELGGNVRDVLARLCPLDLRDESFPVGATARTLLNHVAVSLTRMERERWLLLAPRSYAATVRDKLERAAIAVAAR